MRHSRIPIEFLTSAPVAALSDDGKILSTFLWSNRHASTVGAYRLPVAYVAADLGWSLQRAAEALREAVRARVANYDLERGGWVFVRGFLNANSIKNPAAGKTAAAEVRAIPEAVRWFSLLVLALKPFEAKLPAGFMAECRARALGRTVDAMGEAEAAPDAVETVAATITNTEHASAAPSGAKTEPVAEIATVPSTESLPVLSKHTEEDLRDALRSREVTDANDCDLTWIGAGALQAQELALQMLFQHGIWLTVWGPLPGADDFTLHPWCEHLRPHLTAINHENIEFI